jgi:uncharacterized membrane protein YhaH (DUF805 family)
MLLAKESERMEGLELGTVVLVTSLVLAGLALPVTAVALHQRRRRAYERSAGLRRKEKIRL